jgi:nucleotide-binding universal stress UspA family protein
MALFERILLPVDFTRDAKRALELGVAIAEQNGAELHVLHVWRPSEYLAPADVIQQPTVLDLQPTFEARLKELVASIDTRSVRMRMRVLPGDAVGCILDVVREGFDLVIVGHHHRGLWHKLAGGIAERIARKAPCPVLTVPFGESEPARSAA